MKKYIFVLITFVLFIPNIVLASEIDYDITNYYIQADILTNGDLKVTEVIVLDGTFNGYIRDIKYKNAKLNGNNYENNAIYNASDLEILDVAAKYVNKVNFNIVKENDFNNLAFSKGANGGYLENTIINGKSYKMYYKANREKVAFKITYLLKDVIVAHQDVAELYWNFIGDEYDDVIHDLQIKVNLPFEDKTDNFRIWAHGDLAGEINKYENKYLLATIKRLDTYSTIDIRSTFDLMLINKDLVSKKNNEVALDKIIKVETKRANDANQQRKVMKLKYYIILILVIIWLVLLMIFWVYIYFKYDKEYKNNFNSKYYREFIDEYNVEVIDYLFHKSITSNAMSASIMNLVYKKNIKVEEIPDKKKEYAFHLINSENLTDSESNLVEFLFTEVGSNNRFTTKDLKKYAESSKTCQKFSNSYTVWKRKVINESENQNFYESHAIPKIIGVIFFIISLLICIISIKLFVINYLVYVSVLVGLIFMIYTLCFNKRTVKGNEHYLKWKAFKNFLNDFGTFDIKELPEIKLWERYMVYATIFGLASKVSKVMNVKIQELEENGMYIDGPVYHNWDVYYGIDNSISNSIRANTVAVTSDRANSSSSSGSGFGGGFSSGGGFGGGGGGGHGF